MSLVEARGIWGGNVGARYNGDVFVAQNNLEKRGGILQKEINEYLISAITLIRYIIQVPSDILVRIFFRNKMVTHGLLNIIQVF